MPRRYFENFPFLFYNNKLCRDISRRAKLVESETNSPYVFYPYTLNNQLRSDQLADYYFEDPKLDWLVYLSNGIIDPYYGWYLDDEKFDDLIRQKYTSLEQAQKKIIFYRNNWYNDRTELSPSFYDNTLAKQYKKYYEPIWGSGSKIVAYRRKPEDITMNINRILQYSILTDNASKTFSTAETIDIRLTGTNTVGTGELVFSNSTTVTIKNVSGITTANSSDTKFIIGETSGANVTVDSVITVYENFNEEEEIFWSPVSYYDYERELNESKKELRLIDLSLTDFLIDEFTDKLKDDIDPDTNLPIEET